MARSIEELMTSPFGRVRNARFPAFIGAPSAVARSDGSYPSSGAAVGVLQRPAT